MLILRTKKELTTFLSSLNKKDQLGLVPTMGALHKGHMSLVSRAISENNKVLVSIFVNPTQFNNQKDLDKYPQTLDADKSLLGTISNEIIVFAPTVKEIYPKEIATKTYDFEGLDSVMEGEFRDDHFNGVGTIVEILLRTVKPHKAYFGEKDFQQLQIIKKMVELEAIPVQIIGCPIVRESHGLAMSSRNERLSKNMRQEASLIFEILKSAKSKFGTKSANYVKDWVQRQFEKNKNFKLEYFEIIDLNSFAPFQRKQKNVKYRAFVAVYVEEVRLIDNIALN